MRSMIEVLESRTLLSAGAPAVPFAAMQAEVMAAALVSQYTSPVGRYAATATSTQGGNDGGAFAFVLQQWNVAAGTMTFKIIDGTNVHKGTGTISGRNFIGQVQGGTNNNKTTTITGKVARNYASAAGTFVDKNLRGVQRDSGTFLFTR